MPAICARTQLPRALAAAAAAPVRERVGGDRAARAARPGPIAPHADGPSEARAAIGPEGAPLLPAFEPPAAESHEGRIKIAVTPHGQMQRLGCHPTVHLCGVMIGNVMVSGGGRDAEPIMCLWLQPGSGGGRWGDLCCLDCCQGRDRRGLRGARTWGPRSMRACAATAEPFAPRGPIGCMCGHL